MLPRRALLAASCFSLSLRASAAEQAKTGAAARTVLASSLDALERRHGGRLGVAILDTAHTAPACHRGGERFLLCSTHKVLTAAYVLARVDRSQESLARRIAYGAEDLLPYSPVTAQHAGEGGMSVGQLCQAALTVSDNTAANLLLGSFGGPAALTAYLRSLGDTVTRLDRPEPALNFSVPGDARDTTTPLAMLQTLRKLVLGEALSPPSRAQLAAWLAACQTGRHCLRAGLPQGWRAGDKTGSGGGNATNDVAVLWPPSRPPVLVTAYYTGVQATLPERQAVLAAVGKLAAQSVPA